MYLTTSRYGIRSTVAVLYIRITGTVLVLYILHVQALANFTAWKWQPEKKNRNVAPKLVAYTLTWSFSHESHQCGYTSLSLIVVYMVTGGPQYCDHLGPAPVQWCTHQAAGMCMCMSPWARDGWWCTTPVSLRVAVSVMLAGVTCTSSCELHSLKVATREKESQPGARLWFFFLRLPRWIIKMRLTREPVFVSVSLHYAGFLCEVDVCHAWNWRQFLQELHSNAVKPTSYLYSHYKVKSDSSIYFTLNCCSKPG